jgi:phenol 2-monooxygenase
MAQDPNSTDYPITVTLRHLPPTPTDAKNEDSKSGLYRSNLFAPANEEPKPMSGVATEETVKARYMVGCDGARSWVRKYVIRQEAAFLAEEQVVLILYS